MSPVNSDAAPKYRRKGSRERRLERATKTIDILTETVQARDPESLLWEIERLKAENAELRRRLDITRQP